jgi:hypothetical protein
VSHGAWLWRGFNGGELLHLALAGCVSNDLLP